MSSSANRAQQRPPPNSTRAAAGTRADSQASEPPDIRLLVENMLNDSNKRKQAKRQALQNDYARRAQKVRNDIKAAIVEHEKQRQAEQKQQIRKFIELLKKRKEIERRIKTSVKRLEGEYSARVNELLVVMDDKITDLS